MARDNSNHSTLSLELASHFRGLYNRVADAVNVDPSYVSRVARGERKSQIVEEALKKEIQKIFGKAHLFDGDGHLDGNGAKPKSSKGEVAAAQKNHSNGTRPRRK